MERWDIHGTDAQLPDGSTAWSVEYDTATDTYRSLRLQTNLFCAGGALLADGRVASLGGAGNMSDARVGTLGDGQRSVRTFGSWPGADWVEAVAGLATGRWYPSAANLPDGRVLVVGGSSTGVEFNGGETNVASFEVLGGGGGTQQQPTPLQFLWDALPANLYPVTAVLPSGRVFVFAGNGQLFNVTASTIIVHVGSNLWPFRSYPWTGSGALLPLDPADNYTARVLICGGSMLDCGWGCVTKDCHDNCQSPAATALQTCGLLAPDAPGPQAWDMSDTMPAGRVLADLVHLPDGTLLLINGAHAGMAGTNLGRNASLEAWQYAPLAAPGARWRRLNATTVPRVYHSTAVLLPDARVLVAGSAPNDPGSWGDPTAAPNAYATERRVEYYYPPYLTGGGRRPAVAAVSAMDGLGYGSAVQVLVGSVDPSVVVAGGVDFALVQSGFRTHSTGHAQRMVWLAKTALEVSSAEGGQALYEVVTPPTPEVAPPGWYMLFAVAAGVPSVAAWVQIGGNPSPLQL
ncbi:glyoxal oxidase N-terminus-domain-containing protein [Zopfochytrium polystomum]|nr:glyoxal oxidase N-terminus-domain-containing protein [Zopfochytrium polystomum]